MPGRIWVLLFASLIGFSPFSAFAQTDWSKVKPVLDKRCVVCHGCYDAPCQVKLTSPEGLLRGGSKLAVYHSQRLEDAQPTRLGQDATTVEGWRELGFHPVLPQAQGETSLLERYLALGAENPLPTNAPLPDSLGLALDRPLVCPTDKEFDAFRESHPMAGMPYGTAPLTASEHALLMDWVQNGAALPEAVTPLPDDIQAQVTAWEAFLNAPDPRAHLMNRYLFEHLFLARLHFEGDDPRRFFQIVRSSTPNGEKIDSIATRRPFDDPGSDPFFYRLQQVDETIVHKEHLVYTLSPDRMVRFQALFLQPNWALTDLPSYGDAEGGDPFSTFAAIPARSRYQFLLDDALFFVRSFIRGPVCHGETAVDVIEDRFWVSFLDPDADLSITDPSFLAEGAALLELPVAQVGQSLGDLHMFSHQNQAQYLEFRDTRYRNSPAHQTGWGYDAIWDGEGTNPNALITVFRHFDNASALTGFHGDIPETAWVIDYPVFERIYYNLVARYDVFGRVEHQLATRIYMDELRMESEDNFLTFMPRNLRPGMHENWYRGVLARLHTFWHTRRIDDTMPTGITFETDAPKQEFFLQLLARSNGLWSRSDPNNRCDGAHCAQDALTALASQTGPWVKFLPDLSLLVVETSDEKAEVFTLIHDKAHTNIAFLFDESARREPEKDVLTILPEMIGSYPNFFFKLPEAQLPDFVQAVKSLATQEDWMQLVADFGVRRTSEDFWAISDQIHARFLQDKPIQAGILDLNRYKDPKSGDDPT